MLQIKWIAELYDDVAPQYHTATLTKSARELQKAIGVIIGQIDRIDTHLVQALGEMRRRRRDWAPLPMTTNVVAPYLGELLECSKAAAPRGKVRPAPNRPPKALGVARMMVRLLERLGVRVGATGDEGGPATRLMMKIDVYVSGRRAITAHAIKDRLVRLKDWEARHPEWRAGI
jgi:hypothetical protein